MSRASLLFALFAQVLLTGAVHAERPALTHGPAVKLLPPSAGPRVAVLGSAVDEGIIPRGVRTRLEHLGRVVAQRNGVLLTGSCPGIPMIAMRSAAAAGGLTIGVSPAGSYKEHVQRFKNPIEAQSIIQLTGAGAGMGFIEREAPLIHQSDILVYAGGRSGTLGELVAGMHERKVIAILERSGGVAGKARSRILPHLGSGNAVIVSDANPERLMQKAEQALARLRAEPPSPTIETKRPAVGRLPRVVRGPSGDGDVFTFLGHARGLSRADRANVDKLVDLMASSQKPTLVVPARGGLTAEVAERARTLGMKTIGVSSARTRADHLAHGWSISGLAQIRLTGKGEGAGWFSSQREATEDSHVIFVAGGDYKSLGGMIFGMYQNTVVAVLETKGLSGKLQQKVLSTFDKKPQATVIYDSDPVRLYQRAMNESAKMRAEHREEYLSAE